MNKNYEVLNELVPKTQELHRTIFDKGYEHGQRDVLDKIRAEIDTPNRGTADYFIIDNIEKIINECLVKSEVRNEKSNNNNSDL